MSVLVFMDESRWQQPGKREYFATVAGAAFEETFYDDFCRKILRLKSKFFKRTEIGDYPLRGRSLLSSRALDSYRKVEFVRELFSLSRLQKVTTFSTTRLFSPQKEGCDLREFPFLQQESSISLGDRFDENSCSLLLAYLIERVNSFMLENHPGQLAKLVFKTEDTRIERIISASVMNFMYKTSYGKGFHGILGTPLFVPTSHSPGLQLADLFAYIINQFHGGRVQVRDFFSEVESMQFISSIEQDEYELKGMNLID